MGRPLMRVVNSSEDRSRYRYTADCGGARMFVYARHLAAVLCVDGEVDGSNADTLAAQIRRFTKVQNPVILDLSHLDFLGVAGFRAVLAVNHEQQTARSHF